jgi:hypothetical protein
MIYDIIKPIMYQASCFIHKYSNSLDNNDLVEYIDIILIMHSNIIGIRILYSILNLLMFLIISLPNYIYFTTYIY